MSDATSKTLSNRIAVLDGVRGFCILLIMSFHFWQQSWLQNVIPTDLLRPIGVPYFSLTWVLHTGYMFVDVLILLSGLCLFLPFAYRMTGAMLPQDTARTFYKKRIARILPSYYFCILVYILFFIRPQAYPNFGAYLQDIFSHLTFTHTFWGESYMGTEFPTLLWTLGVEVQFYLIFPLLAKLFRRFPLQSWAVMTLVSEIYIRVFVLIPDGDAHPLRINQFPAFLGVYANGMLLALLLCFLKEWVRPHKKQFERLFTLLLLPTCCAIVSMLYDGLSGTEYAQRWQTEFRFLFSIFICIFIVCANGAVSGFQRLLSNPVLRFVSAISYNLYLWHTTVAIKLKAWRIPYYPDAPENAFAWPQSASGESWLRAWQWQYTLLLWAVSFFLAILVTYGVERPLARLLLRPKRKT